MTTSPTVWLIEDNAAFRAATLRALRSQHLYREVAAFNCCEDALQTLSSGESPDVVLMDIGLPGMNGLEGIRLFKSRCPDAVLMVLTVFEDDEKIFRAICEGASGYLLKGESVQRLAAAIQQALDGGAPLHPRVASRVLTMLSSAPQKQSPEYGLTSRELDVLKRMTEGLGKKQIAHQLGLNSHTTDYVIRCIYRKLHVHGMTAAVSVAIREQLCTKPESK